jgi:hypothetical protein
MPLTGEEQDDVFCSAPWLQTAVCQLMLCN